MSDSSSEEGTRASGLSSAQPAVHTAEAAPGSRHSLSQSIFSQQQQRREAVHQEGVSDLDASEKGLVINLDSSDEDCPVINLDSSDEDCPVSTDTPDQRPMRPATDQGSPPTVEKTGLSCPDTEQGRRRPLREEAESNRAEGRSSPETDGPDATPSTRPRAATWTDRSQGQKRQRGLEDSTTSSSSSSVRAGLGPGPSAVVPVHHPLPGKGDALVRFAPRASSFDFPSSAASFCLSKGAFDACGQTEAAIVGPERGATILPQQDKERRGVTLAPRKRKRGSVDKSDEMPVHARFRSGVPPTSNLPHTRSLYPPPSDGSEHFSPEIEPRQHSSLPDTVPRFDASSGRANVPVGATDYHGRGAGRPSSPADSSPKPSEMPRSGIEQDMKVDQQEDAPASQQVVSLPLRVSSGTSLSWSTMAQELTSSVCHLAQHTQTRVETSSKQAEPDLPVSMADLIRRIVGQSGGNKLRELEKRYEQEQLRGEAFERRGDGQFIFWL